MVFSFGQLVDDERDMLRWMQKKLDMHLNIYEYEKQIVNAEELARLQGLKFERRAGKATHRSIGLFWRQNVQHTIYVEEGFPKPDVFATLAHELTHLWQLHNFPNNTSNLWREGHAVWVSYHICMDFGYEFEARQEYNRIDAIYGIGFRKVRNLENVHSIQKISSVLTALLQMNSVYIKWHS